MKKKMLIMICLIALICSMAGVSAVDDASQTFSDTSILASADGGTFTELYEKVNNAEEGSTVNLENNYIREDSFEKEYIPVAKNITINGNGYTIDANGSSGVFNIYASNVTLNNVNFINSNGYGYLGAVYFYSFGDLTVNACSFVNNSNHGIFSYGSMKIYDCNFINNGGAIYSLSNLTVIASSFVGNSDHGAGAICHVYDESNDFYGGHYGSLGIDNCSFVDNSGYPYSAISSNTVVDDYIYNSVFVSDSENDYYPEDIYTENITFSSHIDLYLPKTIFSRFEPVQILIRLDDGATGELILSINGVEETLTLTNSSVSVTKSDLDVGTYDVLVKYMGDDSFLPSEESADFEVIEESTFSELQQLIDDAEAGSTINLENDYVCDDNRININKPITVNGNGHTLDARGGYSILDIESDNVVLKNITFINSDEWGSAVLVYGNNTIISECNFENNQNYELDGGGALFITGSNTLISNCSFENNAFGGLVNSYGGAISIHGNATLISDCYFNNNCVSGEYSCGGGAVYCDGDLTVVNSAFISNGVSCYDSRGGAIYSKGNLSISDSIFKDNYLYGVDVCGGAIYAENAYVNNSAFDSNSIYGFKSWESGSSSLGGAISSEALNISGSNFTNNSASSDDKNSPARGGAVYSSGILNVEGSNFENNTADNGEALWAYKVYSTVDNCNFTNNDYALVKAYLFAPEFSKRYGGSEEFRVYLAEDGKVKANAKVNININGMDYKRTTNEYGWAFMPINLNSGVYNATVTYEDAIAATTITVMPTVDGENITKIFRNATQYYATFWDSEGYRLKNTEVEFNINGVLYKRFTDDEAVARLNINLNPGEYIITAKNPSSGEFYSNVITVLPNIAENHDLIKYYRNDSQYVVRLLDDEGNPVGAGVNVTFNINGVFYTRTTNATGHAKLNINLEPGTYIITAIYKDLMTSNTITVLPVLEAKDLKMKYLDGSKFEAKLLDGEGNPYVGQNITFNVNGVFYERTTDVNGIARLNINLMPGVYIITSSYNRSNIANRITISS